MSAGMGVMRTGGKTINNYWLVLTESKQRDNGEWEHNCGTDINAEEVVYSVHDGPFASSGSGETRRETVPYCPKCENVPKGGILSA